MNTPQCGALHREVCLGCVMMAVVIAMRED
jgi:hypothetical protein